MLQSSDPEEIADVDQLVGKPKFKCANYTPCFSHLLGCQKAVETAPASQVENGLAGLEVRDGLGISTAQSHVGALRRA